MSARIIHLKRRGKTILYGEEITPVGPRKKLGEDEIHSARCKHAYELSFVSDNSTSHYQLSPKRTIGSNRSAPIEVFEVGYIDPYSFVRDFFRDAMEEIIILLK